MTLPAGAKGQPSLSRSTLGRGVAQLLTLSQVLPRVCGGVCARGPEGRVPAGHTGHRVWPPPFQHASGKAPGMAWFRSQLEGLGHGRDDLRGFRIQAGSSTWGEAETVEGSLCSMWTAGRMWTHHQWSMEGHLGLHLAGLGLLPASPGPRCHVAHGGAARKGSGHAASRRGSWGLPAPVGYIPLGLPLHPPSQVQGATGELRSYFRA